MSMYSVHKKPLNKLSLVARRSQARAVYDDFMSKK